MTTNRVILKIKDWEYDILRFNYKFQIDVDRRGRPISDYYGGEMSVQLESTDDTRLFYQMIHKDMPTVDGSIEILSGEGDICVKRIEFKEAYLYFYGEDVQCTSWLPMTTTIAISPMRLDFDNNTIRIDRKWPRAPHGWQKYEEKEVKYVKASQSVEEENTEVAEIEVITPLTQKDSNPRAGMELGQAYKLRVKSYTNGTPRHPHSIRWEYSYNTNKADGEIVVGAIKDQKGEEIEFTVKDNGAVGNDISFYAYISKQKKEGKCSVYVNPLWRYKGTKEWGQIGMELERKSQRLSLKQMKEEDMLDATGTLRAVELNLYPEQVVRGIYEGNSNLWGVRQVLSDDDNLQQRVLNNFYNGVESKMSFGPTSMLSQKLKVNPTFQEYYMRYLEVIKSLIPKKQIEAIDGDNIVTDHFGSLSQAKPNFSEVKEIFKYDYYGLMGGTQKIKVDLDIMQTDAKVYIIKTRMYIGDWYGADKGDINGLASLKGNVSSLNAFFWLQHHYGYHPFETEIIYESIDRIEL